MRSLVAGVGLLCLAAMPAWAAVTVVDDAKRTVTLPAPARRIVSLAPHATEILYAAGAGGYVIGVTEFSDYPPEAKKVSSVGSGVSLDLESIIRLKPDLVVGWNNGSAANQLDKLATLGIPVFKSEPHDYLTIASSLERLAHLAGTDKSGKAAAEKFRTRLQQLRTTYQHRPNVSVFYQIWRSPLMTLNGTHMVSAALRLCGGENIFSKLPQIAPTVSLEAVLNENPDAIIASSGAKEDPFVQWRRFPKLEAVARNNLLTVNADLLNRAGPRVIDGTEELCEQLDKARRARP
jgi:iron complex transport system substrate-binding protein